MSIASAPAAGRAASPTPQTLMAAVLVAMLLVGCGGGDDNGLQDCLNGVVNSGEQCDDGNLVDTDGCTTACLRARCGDGVVHAGVEACDAPDLAGATCASFGLTGADPGCTGSCDFDLSPCGETFTPSATATATATSTATPPSTATATPFPTGMPTFTGTVTPTVTPSPTPTQDPCGDGLLDPVDPDGDGFPELDEICAACPEDCTALACEPSDQDVTYVIDFTPAAGQQISAITLLIGYQSDVLNLPATEIRQRVRPVSPPLPQAFSVNGDLGGVVARVVMTRSEAIQGPQLTARFATCDGAPPASSADVVCIVEGCAGASGRVPGCSCSATVQP